MSWPPAFPILSILVWTPAVGALLSVAAGENRDGLRRKISLGSAALSLALAFALVAIDPGADHRELRRWIPALGLSYDLRTDGFGSILILWVALLSLLSLLSEESRDLGRRAVGLILLAETTLFGLVTAADGVLFLAFYGAGLLAVTILLGRNREMKTFFFFQSAGAALAALFLAVSYHLAWTQTGFPSAEIARFSSLVVFPDFHDRMFLLGGAAVVFAAPLFPLGGWVPRAASTLTPSGRLVLVGAWSLAGTLFFVRVVSPFLGTSESALWLMAVAALSPLYAALAPRRSGEIPWAPLLVGSQGLVVLGLLSPVARGVGYGRAGMLQLALGLSVLALWRGDSEDARGPGATSLIAVAMFLPTSWLVLREQWITAPALTALAGIGLLLMLARLARSLPRLSRRRWALLLPLLGFWVYALVVPSSFVPRDSEAPVTLEEE